jgi:hypothetical protein
MICGRREGGSGSNDGSARGLRMEAGRGEGSVRLYSKWCRVYVCIADDDCLVNYRVC